jgi:4-hydroxybenzoate polyprenyltransferase
MAFNRFVDRRIDARNPRTERRELPAGVLTPAKVAALVVLASALFVFAAWQLNPLCAKLAPLVLAVLFFYSFTKRFTRFAHVALGLGMSIAPVGGYLAVTGRWSEPWWMLCALATAVVTWGAGFDVLYALPDIAFDRAQGLHSIPAALGEGGAIAVSRGLHAITLLSLALVGLAVYQGDATASVLYWTGVLVVAALLTYEHSLVRPGDLSRLDAAFFTMNGIISLLLFGFVLAGRLYVAWTAVPHGVR